MKSRLQNIREAWRGPCFGFNYSPAEWMSDAELEAIAARVKGISPRDIAYWQRLAENSKNLLDACRLALERLKAANGSRNAKQGEFMVSDIEQAITNATKP